MQQDDAGRYAHERIGGRWILHALYRRGRIWYGRVRDERTGEIFVRSSRESQKRKAREVILAWIAELRAIEEGGITPTPLRAAIDEWFEVKRTFSREASLVAPRAFLERLLVSFGDIDVDQVSYTQIERYFIAHEWSSTTWNHYKTIAAEFFEWSKKRRYTSVNPARDLPRKKQTSSNRRALSAEEARRLLSCARKEGHPLYLPLIVFFHTALRRKNVFGMRWRNVDLETNALRFDAEEPRMKSGRTFTLPLHPVLRRALIEHMGSRVPRPEDFVHYREWRFPTLPFARLQRRAEIDPTITFHEIRHTVSSWLALTVPWAVLQALLDHRPSKGPGGESSAVTWGYTHIPWSALVEGIETLPNLLDEPGAGGSLTQCKSP